MQPSNFRSSTPRRGSIGASAEGAACSTFLREYPHCRSLAATQCRPFTTSMLKNIRIENPVSDHGFTSKQRAKRFVAKKLAAWVVFGVSIRFTSTVYRAAAKSVDKSTCGYDRASGTGMARARELAAIPVVAPAKALGFGKNSGANRHTFMAARGF